MKRRDQIECQVCHGKFPPGEVLPGEMVRPAIAALIREKNPGWSPSGYICLSDLNHYRMEHMEDVLERERGELSGLDEDVMRSLRAHELVSGDVNAAYEQTITLGERLADRIAEFGGSWRFIIIFGAIIAVWVAMNTWVFVSRPFDPYPFILLNLVLSCLAALQAPVIMMSQNRQEAKDRIRGEHDYRVNLKAELEIRMLQEKVDHLIMHQWQRLLEIQEIQTELMEELLEKENKTR